MAKTNDIVFGIRADSTGFNSGLDKAEKKVKGVQKKTGGMLSKVSGGIGKWAGGLGAAIVSPIGAALAGAAVVSTITKGLTASFSSAMEDAQLDKRMGMMLQGMGQGAAVPQLMDLANNMEKAFNIDDNTIKKGFEVMLQNGLGAAEIKGLSGLAADIHKATGEEFSEVSKDLAEAAQGETTVLEKYGIWYEKTGDRVKDAAAAMQLLQQRFKGQGAAMAGMESPMTKIGIAMGNIGEKIGAKLMPLLNEMADKVTGFVTWLIDSGYVDIFMDTIIGTIETISGYVSTAIDFWIDLWNSKLMPVVNYWIGFLKDVFGGLTNGNFFATIWEMLKLYIGIAVDYFTMIVPKIGEIIFNAVKSSGGMIAGWLLDKFGWMLPDSIKEKAKEMADSFASVDIVPDDLKDSMNQFSESVTGRVQETREKLRAQNGTTEPINDNYVGTIQPDQAGGLTEEQRLQQQIYGQGNTNVTTKFSRDETAKYRQEQASKAAQQAAKEREKRLKQLQGLNTNKAPVVRLYAPQQFRMVQSR